MSSKSVHIFIIGFYVSKRLVTLPWKSLWYKSMTQNFITKLSAFASYKYIYLRFYQYCNFYFLKVKVRKTETAIHSNKRSINYFDLTINNIVPVLKLTTMSMRKMVSDRQLNAIHRVDKSSLKKEMATGKTMRLATNSISIHKSQ